MQNDQEFSETPTGDAAEEFLNSPNGQESKPSLLQKEVLRLYAQAESIKELLQGAAVERNPGLLDSDSLLKKWGLELGSNTVEDGDYGTEDYRQNALADTREGKIDLTCDVSGEFLDPAEPRLVLEEKAVARIDLRNWGFGNELLNKGIRDNHAYMLGVVAYFPGSENPVDYSFIISDKGDIIKSRYVYTGSGDVGDIQLDLEVIPHDSELVGVAIGILKSHLTRALASPNQDQ